MTALGRDPEFAEGFRTRFIGPKVERTRELFARAEARGELRDGVDLDVVGPALAGIVLHSQFVLGQQPTEASITAVIDQVILPAVLRPTPVSTQGPLMTDSPTPETTMDGSGVDDTIVESVPPESSRRLGWALVIICMAQLMVVLDSTIANIALPYIGRDLEVSQNNLQWIVTGYALAFGGLLLLGGRLADLYGRRRIFMTGLVLFAAASALGGLAQNEAMLLGSRALQGVGAAMAAPAALALITTTFPAGPLRNRAFSIYAALSGVGAAIGLILGGWLTGLQITGLEGWRLTFLINVPIGLAAAWVAPKFLPESEPRRVALDVPGALSGTVGIASLVYGLSRAGDERYGWGDTFTIAALVAAAVLLIGFVVIESTVKNPLLPLSIFANRARSVAFLTMMITPAAMFAMFFFLSLFVQNVLGYSPLHTGFAFLPFTFGIIVGATVASKLIAHIAPRFIAGTGTIFAGLALFMFSRITVDDSPANLMRIAMGKGSLSRLGQLLDRDRPVHRADGRRHGPGVRDDDARRAARHPVARTPASAQACSTRCSRSAAPSAWPACPPWRCTSPATAARRSVSR